MMPAGICPPTILQKMHSRSWIIVISSSKARREVSELVQHQRCQHGRGGFGAQHARPERDQVRAGALGAVCFVGREAALRADEQAHTGRTWPKHRAQLTAPLTLVRQDDGAFGRVDRLRKRQGRQERRDHAATTLLGCFAQDGAPARLPPLVGRLAHQAARGDDWCNRRGAQFGQLLQDGLELVALEQRGVHHQLRPRLGWLWSRIHDGAFAGGYQLHQPVDRREAVEHAHETTGPQPQHAPQLMRLVLREPHTIAAHLVGPDKEAMRLHARLTKIATQSCSCSVRSWRQPASRRALRSSSARSASTPESTAAPLDFRCSASKGCSCNSVAMVMLARTRSYASRRSRVSVPLVTWTTSATPLRSTFSWHTPAATTSISTASTEVAPRRAAAIARIPEPAPTSSTRMPGSTHASTARRHRRVVG